MEMLLFPSSNSVGNLLVSFKSNTIHWQFHYIGFNKKIHTTLKDLATAAAERAAVRKTGRADNIIYFPMLNKELIYKSLSVKKKYQFYE